MNCGLCDLTIEDNEKKTEAECGCFYHTNCAMEAYRTYFLNFYPDTDLLCRICAAVLYEVPAHMITHQTVDDTIPVRMQQPAFVAELKKLKAKKRERGTNLRLLTAVLREQYTAFMNIVRPHIDAIKTAKAATETALKQTPAYIEYLKCLRSFTASESRFIRKHALTRFETRTLFPRGTWGARWRYNVKYIFRRKFRIRL